MNIAIAILVAMVAQAHGKVISDTWGTYKILTLLLFYFVGLHRILYRVIEEVDLPDSIETVLSPLKSSKEFPF